MPALAHIGHESTPAEIAAETGCPASLLFDHTKALGVGVRSDQLGAAQSRHRPVMDLHHGSRTGRQPSLRFRSPRAIMPPSYLQRDGGVMTNEPVKGPASYFPSIEKKYGRPIAEWQTLVRQNLPAKHM